MDKSSLLSLCLCFLVIFHCCVAQIEQVTSYDGDHHRQRLNRAQQDQCRLDNLNAAEPSRSFQSEAGVTEVWDENDEQFQCTGVVAIRHTIQQRGLLLPQYANGPKLIYVVQGNGVQGALIPGCPETYQSPSESEYRERRQSQGDQHQKVRQLREGDVVALPAGVAQWIYNNGRSPLVLVQIIDTSNPANQLDQSHRLFFLAGNPHRKVQSQRGESERRHEWSRGESLRSHQRSGNVFSGLDEQLLAEAFNVNRDIARRLKGENDNRGIIVSVEGELEYFSPRRNQEEEKRERQFVNGIEETFCTARLKHNINDPSRADIYNPRGGHVTNVNSHNFPILRHLRLSVQKGVLFRNAIFAPHWNINAHSIYYFTRGNGHVQIVDENGDAVFDGQVQQGQILTAPQNFVVLKRASNEGLEWVSFKTNENAQISPLAGRTSAIRALPEAVVANAFQISREDARRLKENRQEVTVFSPGSRSRN